MHSLFDQPVAGFCQVAVERGMDRYPDGLTYAVPQSLADLQAGERVIVPLGRGDLPTPGYVIEIMPEVAEGVANRLKQVSERDRVAARLPGELLDLARWMSNYYCAPIGMTLATMLPGPVKKNVGAVRRLVLDIAPTPPEDHKLTKSQQRIIDALSALPTTARPVEQRQLMELAEIRTAGPIKRLLEAGWLVSSARTVIEAGWTKHNTDDRVPDALTAPQQQVIDAIGSTLGDASARGGFFPHLLFGVTGSGKTEVYIRLFQKIVDAGMVGLLLVPEISLTPQTAGRLLGRFPDCRVAVLHSGLTAAQRHQQWAMVAEGEAELIIGARSAVFAPVPNDRLGLIIVDEEHDGSYKQDQVPRYHGRDVAIRRAQLAGIPIVLGSATPAIESWYNARRGAFALHTLSERAPGLRLPDVRIVDLANVGGGPPGSRLITPVLGAAIRRTLDSNGQAVILLNRRGYASYINCRSKGCGWIMNCNDCDVTMVYHQSGTLRGGGFVRCHHCLTEQRLPPKCPDCSGSISTFSFGTQRVEQELMRQFPELISGETLLRIDSDTMRSAKHYHDALERFGRGDVHVLMGTQMIAKGLDFPGVRLVGIINADTAINLPDFRASERTFQLVSQVAGRAGRSTSSGTVIVQTLHPEAVPIVLAARHDYATFAEQELADRKACQLPPYARMARLVIRDTDGSRAIATATQIANSLRTLLSDGATLEGPSACPIARIANQYRHEIILRAPSAAGIQRVLSAARSAGVIRAGAAVAIDVDPIALM